MTCFHTETLSQHARHLYNSAVSLNNNVCRINGIRPCHLLLYATCLAKLVFACIELPRIILVWEIIARIPALTHYNLHGLAWLGGTWALATPGILDSSGGFCGKVSSLAEPVSFPGKSLRMLENQQLFCKKTCTQHRAPSFVPGCIPRCPLCGTYWYLYVHLGHWECKQITGITWDCQGWVHDAHVRPAL